MAESRKPGGGVSRFAQRRVGLLFAVFVLLLSTAVARSFWMSVVQASDLQAAADLQQSRPETIRGLRGEIRDRHGFALAASQPAFDVMAVPSAITEPGEVASLLGPLLGIDAGRLQDELDRVSRLPRPGDHAPTQVTGWREL